MGKNVVILSVDEYNELPASSDIKLAATELKDQLNIRVITFQDVLESGDRKPLPQVKTKPDHVFSLYYTSGTTGEPKAAMLQSNPNAWQMAKGNFNAMQVSSFGHIPERLLSWNCAMSVSRYCLNSAAPSGYIHYDKLIHDFRDANPAIVFFQPWFWNHLYHTILEDIEKTWFLKRWLIKWGISVKMELLKENYVMHHFWDWLVLSHFRSYMGGTISTGFAFMVTGAAPINTNIKHFLTVVMARPMIEGYGMTEMNGSGLTTIFHDVSNQDHTGGIGPSSELKIIDVPELGYRVTNKDADGNLAPRGEVLVRGPAIFPGYCKDPEQTAKALDKDGWLHTGDIAVLCPDRNGALKLIDRKGHFFKLNTGKFITPDRLEQLYKNCKGVANFWIYGEPAWGHIVAVVNVYPAQYLEICRNAGIKGDDWEKLFTDDQAKKVFLEELQANVKKDNIIMDFEIVKGIIIEPETFMDLGMYTDSGKIKRRALAARYKDQIELLHKKLE